MAIKLSKSYLAFYSGLVLQTRDDGSPLIFVLAQDQFSSGFPDPVETPPAASSSATRWRCRVQPIRTLRRSSTSTSTTTISTYELPTRWRHHRRRRQRQARQRRYRRWASLSRRQRWLSRVRKFWRRRQRRRRFRFQRLRLKPTAQRRARRWRRRRRGPMLSTKMRFSRQQSSPPPGKIFGQKVLLSWFYKSTISCLWFNVNF